MSGVRGKNALITGASSGIGAAIARALARAGANALLLTGRDGTRLEAVAADCVGAGTVDLHAATLDDEAEIVALANRAGALPGGLDLLIHSAGVFASGSVAETAPAEFERQWRVNTWAPYALTHYLLAALRASRGQVVFINSGAGAAALPNCSAYCGSKYALRALADCLRLEVQGDGVRVMSAMLGKIATPMQERIQTARTGEYHPEYYPSADDVAGVLLAALALPANAAVTELALRPAGEPPRLPRKQEPA